MPEILIYTANLCPYCTMAKKLFEKKGVSYSEINVDSKPGLRQEMMQQTQRRTVPQIFINDQHIGGFDDLHALESKNELDSLLVKTT
jgi:glutaredoxin 3